MSALYKLKEAHGAVTEPAPAQQALAARSLSEALDDCNVIRVD